MLNENIQYRLPLVKLINSYIWAKLTKSAKAILPVIGVHIDLRSNKGWPGIELIAELAGYSDLRCIRSGIEDLISYNLITRQKEGRHYVYHLTDLSFSKLKTGYFPFFKEAMIISRKWAGLTSSEKSLYSVFGNKGTVNNPEIEGTDIYAAGNIYEHKKYIEWAGISRWSFKSACRGLERKGLIEFEEEEDFCEYYVYVPGFKRVQF